MSIDVESWIGRSAYARDIASIRELRGIAALLDSDVPLRHESLVPPLGHWLYFPPNAPQSEMGDDGHPKQGDGLIPDTGLPRRMWAGSRVEFVKDMALGARIERTSTLTGAKRRSGRSGALIFITLQHEISADGELIVREEQDIVYRAPPEPGAPPPAPEAAPAMSETRTLVIDPVRLFRFSALTFNAHRIHYDRDYAVREEGYQGLVVHGPYVAMMLMDHLMQSRPDIAPRRFTFRGVAPLFEGETLTLGFSEREGGYDLAASGSDGRLTMKASVEV